MTDLTYTILTALAVILSTGLLVGIGFAVKYLLKLIEKIDFEVAREALEAALLEAEKAARRAILATKQIYVDELKEANKDGKLTDEEKKRAMEMAKGIFLQEISAGAKEILEAALGPIQDWITGFLEGVLADVKMEELRIIVDETVNPT